MALTTGQNINSPNGTKYGDGIEFVYSNTSINVNINNVDVTGDVIRISNLDPEEKETEDGGNTSITIESASVSGDVINQSETGGVVISNSTVEGSASIPYGSGSVTVINSSVSSTDKQSESGNIVLVDSTVGGESVPNTEGFVAIIDDGTPYKDLQTAINEVPDGGTITLINDVPITHATAEESAITIPDNKNVTIEGNNHTIEIALSGQKSQAISVGTTRTSTTRLNLNNTVLNISGTQRNEIDGIDVWGNLTLNNSDVTLENLRGAFVMQGGENAQVHINDGSVVNIEDITGNASNGGQWTVADSTINIDGCGSYGLSVSNLTTTGNTDININDTGYGAIYVYNDLVLNDGTDVVITNCGGTDLPRESIYGDCNAPIQIREGTAANESSPKQPANPGASITINAGATVTITGCTDRNGANNEIYIPTGVTYTSNGTVNATVTLEDTTMNLVTVINRNNTSTVLVADGVSFPLSNPGTYNGYTFGGWRGSNGLVYKAGDSVVINSDMTFTAIWNAINVPDTHNITIANTVNGTVSTNFSNASAGSTVTITAAPADGYAVSSVAVTGPDGRVNVTRVDATTYTFVMPDGAVTVSVSFGPATVTLPFTDVTTGDWFYDEVAYVYANGLMDGVSATRFDPNGTMTRAMVWAILARVDGQTVTGDNWIETARAWAMAEGVSDGENATGAVTREQLVTMLWRYAGEPAGTASLSAYTDAGSVSDWASTAMSWAIANGIIEGMSADTIVPGGTATRAQCAAILMRYVTL